MIVIKRDGTTQEFDEEKIAKVVKAAGLDEVEAKKLARVISKQVEEEAHVTSLEIRDLVAKQLHQTDKYAADLFDWYQKEKEEGKV